jgi:rare lipoprotein A
MRKLAIGCVVALVVALSGRSVAEPPACVATMATASPQSSNESGLASWYGEERQGKPTANGEVFDMNGLTAAHREFPMGTKVKVTNVKNHRTLILRINDRGPGITGRVIDVSMAAAKSLGFLHSGVAPVELEVVSLPKPRALTAARRPTPTPASLANLSAPPARGN